MQTGRRSDPVRLRDARWWLTVDRPSRVIGPDQRPFRVQRFQLQDRANAQVVNEQIKKREGQRRKINFPFFNWNGASSCKLCPWWLWLWLVRQHHKFEVQYFRPKRETLDTPRSLSRAILRLILTDCSDREPTGQTCPTGGETNSWH